MIRYIARCVPMLFFLVSTILAPPRSGAQCNPPPGNGQQCYVESINLGSGNGSVNYQMYVTPRTCLVAGKYTYHYSLTQDSSFNYVNGGPPIPIPDASGFPISFTIIEGSPGYPGCPKNGVSGIPGTLFEKNYQVYVYRTSGTCSGFPSGCISANYASGVFGYINPKYVVADVRYAPPGSKSSVVYSTGTTISNTQTHSSTFTTSNTVSDVTKVSPPIQQIIQTASGIMLAGWLNGSVTNSYSQTETQSTTNGSSVTVTRTDTDTLTLPGPTSDYVGLNHDLDLIDVWINPVLLFTVYNTNVTGETKVVFWGYGSSALDPTAPIDIWSIPAGCLNGDTPRGDTSCSTPLQQFQRTWAANENWPSGQGPGLTQADLNNILAADPWGSCTQSSPQGSSACPTYFTPGFVLPNFSLSDQTNVQYVQPSPGGGPQQFSHLVSTTNAATSMSSTTSTYSQTWGWEDAQSGTGFLSLFSDTLSFQNTLSWSYTFGGSLTKSGTKTGTANVTGPACVGTPCNPSYPPSPDTLYGTAVSFDIFVDGRFGTFAFLPSAY